jgi:sugar diacid utilization regulator
MIIHNENEVISMKYEELFQLKDFQKGKLLTGDNILLREITGAHVIEMADGVNWARRGELVFTSGVGFHDIDHEMKILIQTVAKNYAAGIIIEIGPYIKEISQEWIDHAQKLNIPLMTLPYDIPVTNIISEIYRNVYNTQEYQKSIEKFMTECLYEFSEEIYERAKRFGFDEKKKHIALFLSPDRDKGDLEHLMQACRQSMNTQKLVLTLVEADGVAAIYDLEETKIPVHEVISKLRSNVESFYQIYHKEDTISAGAGDIFQAIRDLKDSVVEAKQALNMLHMCKRTAQSRMYEEMGIYQLLFSIKNDNIMDRIIEEQIGSLQTYDRANDTQLMKTLDIYLQEDCNVARTTERLYVHRNTVKYRIKRIQELLGRDLHDINVKFNLQLAFKIRKFLGQES